MRSLLCPFQVPAQKCPNLRPPARESCRTEKCPQWYTGIWSEVREREGSAVGQDLGLELSMNRLEDAKYKIEIGRCQNFNNISAGQGHELHIGEGRRRHGNDVRNIYV